MNTTQKPSEHAKFAGQAWLSPDNYPWSDLKKLIWHIDQHAIAPAVAERDKRIAELEEALQDAVEHCYDLRGEWGWKKDEPRAGNKSQYDRLCEVIANGEALLATKGQP